MLNYILMAVIWATPVNVVETVDDLAPPLIWASPKDVTEAVSYLAPRLPRKTVRSYVKIIITEARAKLLDPLLLVSFIDTESQWNRRLVSATNDYGLTQIHVAKRGSARFLGREHELFDPRTNINEWCRLAEMWRNYHYRACTWGKHAWWAHLKYGYVVPPGRGYNSRAKLVYDRVVAKLNLPGDDEGSIASARLEASSSRRDALLTSYYHKPHTASSSVFRFSGRLVPPYALASSLGYSVASLSCLSVPARGASGRIVCTADESYLGSSVPIERCWLHAYAYNIPLTRTCDRVRPCADFFFPPRLSCACNTRCLHTEDMVFQPSFSSPPRLPVIPPDV